MSSFHGYFPITRPASGATLNEEIYLKVYGGASGGTATLNGTLVNIAAGSTIDLAINSISGVSGDIYLLGMPKNVLVGSSVLGGYGG